MWETDHCQLHALPEAFIEVFFLHEKIFTLSRFGARLRNNTGVLLSVSNAGQVFFTTSTEEVDKQIKETVLNKKLEQIKKSSS